MITQDYLDSEITLAKQIFIYYTDKVANYLIIGSDKYVRWYIDSLQIYFLLELLSNTRIKSDLLYIGAEEIEDDLLLLTFRKVREYWTNDIDTNYEFTAVPISPTPPIINGVYNKDWKEFTLTITEGVPSTVALPVNLTNIADLESIQLVVNGMSDPNYTTNVGLNGYHVIGSTLYWHNFYDLLVGDSVRVQYLQISD